MSTRIPTLDGWRGIAILLVLFDHLQLGCDGRILRPWTATGQHGVTIFFVLSGFLITSKLIEEPIDLRHFYVRRFFRLMPAAWAYLAVLLLLNRLTGVRFISVAELRGCLLFYHNFQATPWMAGHFWSLSIEEQFYLFWPCLLLLTRSRCALWIAASGAGLVATYRFFFWDYYARLGYSTQSQVRMDSLLVGCMLALLLADPKKRALAAKWSPYWVFPAIASLAYSMVHFHILIPLFESVAIAALICASVLHPVKALTYRPLSWLGAISYSIYLWQELFALIGRTPLEHFASLGVALPVFVLGSYYCIERPFTRLGHRLSDKSVGSAAGRRSGDRDLEALAAGIP